MKLKLVAVISLAFACTHVQAETTQAPQMPSQPQPQTQTQMPPQTTMDANQNEADKNKKDGDAFLQQNKTKPGVVSLPDGLQYKVLVAGNGAKPEEKDMVTVEYVGSFIDGKEFDNSAKHGGSINFPVGQVIPGWVEALKLMPVGSTWEIYIPPTLAYGDKGVPPVIGPNQTLIFKIKLIDAKKSS